MRTDSPSQCRHLCSFSRGGVDQTERDTDRVKAGRRHDSVGPQDSCNAHTQAHEDGHDDEVATKSGDGGTNAAVGDDTLETERSDSQPSQAGPYLTGSAQKY